ncbi:MAG: tRNA-dihydrouridine synthase family protein [Planctomycetota bacterium]|nr:tRNA-dihydrouridine synthase family protein [Planctomycetota bacterium]
MPTIGPVHFDQPFCQAGLAGYSDRAMRLVARRRGCPYAVTEALLDVILVNGGEGLRKSIDISDEDHPVAGQIIGSEPHTMARGASLLQQAGYHVIDLNFACPVKKIKNKARGGHMLLDVARAVSILKAVRDALPPDVPTTVSLRRGFDDSPESVDRFHEIVETMWALGYAAVRVHARTVDQKYTGQARWPFLRDVKLRYPDRTIIGSGDLFTAEDVVRMLRETGVDCAWIARGAIGNPWIFQHAAALLATAPSPLVGEGGGEGAARALRVAFGEAEAGTRRFAEPRQLSLTVPPHPSPLPQGERRSEINPPSIHEQRDALAEHFAIAMEIHGESLAGRRMRKMGIKYSRFHPDSTDVKGDFIAVQSLRDWTNVLEKWYSTDGPGVWPDPKAADEVNAGAGADLQSCEAG